MWLQVLITVRKPDLIINVAYCTGIGQVRLDCDIFSEQFILKYVLMLGFCTCHSNCFAVDISRTGDNHFHPFNQLLGHLLDEGARLFPSLGLLT